jgi:chemotaxis family two-component system response regulator Rcp1
VRRALEVHNLNVELIWVQDGQAALGFVDRADAGEITSNPDLVLLDLNLPRATGLRILERLRQSHRLASTPVIMVTSSGSQADKDAAMNMGAAHYFQKPSDLAGFMQLGGIVRSLLGDAKAAMG